MSQATPPSENGRIWRCPAAAAITDFRAMFATVRFLVQAGGDVRDGKPAGLLTDHGDALTAARSICTNPAATQTAISLRDTFGMLSSA